MRRVAALAAPLAAGLVLLCGAAPPGRRDPDWPCFQIKVADLSVAAVWTGPPTEAYAATWSADQRVAELVAHLSERRLPIDQAEAAITAFAAAAGSARRDKLLAVFAGLFDTLDHERASVITGLDRYGRRQKQLADQLRGEVEALHSQQDAARPDPQQVATLTERLGWDTRVFDARRQSISFACDVPNVIEQRLFALARIIQQAVGT